MKTVCIGGKNNITVNVLEYATTHLENVVVVAILNRNDMGVDGWQRSVKKYCITHNIPIMTLEEVYNIEDLVFISTEFDRIIKPNKFKSEQLFNIHFSLLPKYKGMYTPILPILNGDSFTGVTLHVIRSGIDTGEIIAQEMISIEKDMNSFMLYQKLIEKGTEVVINNLRSLINGEYQVYKQPKKNSSYFGTGYIDYKNLTLRTNCTADQIYNQIYAYAFRPYQLVTFRDVKLLGAMITDNVSNKMPGTVIDEDDVSLTISTIDYDIVVYKDVLDNLFDAVKTHDNDKAKQLCTYKLIVNEKDVHGWTPLTVAVYNNNFDMARYLIGLGANERVVNNNGTTLLMFAKDCGLITGDWKMFRYLIGLGLSVYDKDYGGQSLVDYLSKDRREVPDDIKEIIKDVV